MTAPITFSPAPIPENKSGRKAEPNPFLDAVQGLVDNSDAEGKSLGAIQVVIHEDETDKMIRKAQEAGAALGVTVRKSLGEPDKDGNVSLTLWTVPRIVRPRKDTPEDSGE